jgi:hypothetical protein
MKFLVPNYSCLQNPGLGGYHSQIPVRSVLCPQLNLLNPPLPRTKVLVTQLLSSNHCCSGKAIGGVYSESVSVALVIQHAMRMRHIVICSLSGSTTFSTLSHKRHDFRRNATEYKMCSLIFSTTFV